MLYNSVIALMLGLLGSLYLASLAWFSWEGDLVLPLRAGTTCLVIFMFSCFWNLFAEASRSRENPEDYDG